MAAATARCECTHELQVPYWLYGTGVMLFFPWAPPLDTSQVPQLCEEVCQLTDKYEEDLRVLHESNSQLQMMVLQVHQMALMRSVGM